jgi:hypothetical protein
MQYSFAVTQSALAWLIDALRRERSSLACNGQFTPQSDFVCKSRLGVECPIVDENRL